jgi:hypothetical protein
MDHQAFAQLLGNYGEFLGSIGVIATLIYLAIQIRQNTSVAQASTRQAIAESGQALTRDFLDSREMAEIFVRHLGGERLAAVDRLRLNGRCYRDMRHWENIRYQLRQGLLATDEWSGFRNNLAALFQVQAYREHWQAEAALYGDAFRREVDSIRSESGIDEVGRGIAMRFRDESVDD